jgi:hypothetical protein
MNDPFTVAPPVAAGADALSLLASAHRHIDRLFAEYEAAGADAPVERRRELTIHATIEEQLFYPALRKAGAHQSLLERAHEEHVEACALVTEIQAAIAEGRNADWKVGQLIHSVRTHLPEEETELFAAARQCGVDLRRAR